MTKHIFVTGGVVSSLGKGLTSASIGCILERWPRADAEVGPLPQRRPGNDGFRTSTAKSTCLTTRGNRPRPGAPPSGSRNSPLSRDSNFTSGRIYLKVIEKERQGKYLGGTVQVVPHVTDEIKASVRKLASPDVDVVITELGGTVGDIEGLPF
ncbi:MAG: hypothetical protein U0872_12610 [Planctomycetaceae bacterium]